MAERSSYEDSCKFLAGLSLLEANQIPSLPGRPPRHDNEALGVSFFRTRIADVNLEKLTLPRTFFGRSEIRHVSFRHSDLSESTANWNDFVEVDFSQADLSSADFRGSILERMNFCGAVLRNADFRRVAFRNCVFKDADFTHTKLVRSLAWLFRLSRNQRHAVDWHLEPGPEPDGG